MVSSGGGPEISFTFDTSDFDAMVVDIKDPTRRATMYTLRAVGRRVAAAAKARTPVYDGPDPRATAESGQLRKSIKNARTIKRGGDTYSLTVGPRGDKKKGTAVHRRHSSGKELRGVPLYAGKIEAKTGYMESGLADAGGLMHSIFDEAYAKAWAKWSV